MAILIPVAVFLVLADRALKTLALAAAPDRETGILPGVLAFAPIKNQNIAFSLPLSGLGLDLVIFFILSLLLVFIIRSRGENNGLAVFLTLIFIGGASNLFDRLRYGAVIDYIDLFHLTVFNLADAMITFGVLGLFLLIAEENRKKTPASRT